jgi:hypothetical protein
MRELPYMLAFDQVIPECLRNMCLSLAVKKLDVVGAVSSSIVTKYSLQVAVIRILIGVGTCSITLRVSLPLFMMLGGSSIVGSSVPLLVGGTAVEVFCLKAISLV